MKSGNTSNNTSDITQLKMSQLSLKHNKLTTAIVKDFSLNKKNEYFINLNGIEPLEANTEP